MISNINYNIFFDMLNCKYVNMPMSSQNAQSRHYNFCFVQISFSYADTK